MGNLFLSSEAGVIAILGIPTLLYLAAAHRRPPGPIEQLSETIANYNLFNSLYSIFLGLALVTLMVNFNTVQDDTRKEAEDIISATRLINGLSEGKPLTEKLIAYAKAVVEFDLPAMGRGEMSPQASTAFDALWNQAYAISLTSKKEESIHSLMLGDLSDITKCRLTRRMKAKENLHPMIFFLIVFGYYVMLVKTYLTRVGSRKTQLAFELPMFAMVILVITTIIDLNTPFVGIVNIDTTAFRWALERATAIAATPRP
uniref:Uncharacterized protein n=1 Tax=Desulfovibrio sp. U5L TaxID=596152 RepID=I2PWK8_9BACT